MSYSTAERWRRWVQNLRATTVSELDEVTVDASGAEVCRIRVSASSMNENAPPPDWCEYEVNIEGTVAAFKHIRPKTSPVEADLKAILRTSQAGYELFAGNVEVVIASLRDELARCREAERALQQRAEQAERKVAELESASSAERIALARVAAEAKLKAEKELSNRETIREMMDKLGEFVGVIKEQVGEHEKRGELADAIEAILTKLPPEVAAAAISADREAARIIRDSIQARQREKGAT